MQTGVSNMHMATSFIYDWKADKVAGVEGVKRVTPISYLNTIIKANDKESFSFVVGLLPDADRAGPWAMAEGRGIENKGEVVIPSVLSNLTGADIGGKVTITDKEFTIVGLSEGTFSSANAITFIDFTDLEDILSSTGTYSFLLVDIEEGLSPQLMSKRIKEEVSKVNALPQSEFVKNDFAMAMQMGVEIIFMMTVICSALAVLIVGFTSYSLVMKKKREIAIIKALGIRNSSIFAGIVFQSVVVASLGFLFASLFAVLVIPRLPALLPQLSLSVSAMVIVRIGVAMLVISAIGALIPAYTVSKLDPAEVFNA
jgi:ABC-type antimicrobial peptide transport system permease subunit